MINSNDLVIVRGGGDLATGIIHSLHKAGFRVLILETEYPAAIRRQVAFSEAIYDRQTTIENVTAVRVDGPAEEIGIPALEKIWDQGAIPIIADSTGISIQQLRPEIVVDAIIAKRNIGTYRDMAPITIGIGPGFCAGKDVDFVVETKRGHNLGRIISDGYAAANTGIPGEIAGYTRERVIHAQSGGILYNIRHISDIVKKGEEIAVIVTEKGDRIPVLATIDGILRGLIRNQYFVTRGFKIADIDPREEELQNCFTISDKARCIAGSVLELVCEYYIKIYYEKERKRK